MKFIEMTGAVLRKIVNKDEFPDGAFEAAGIDDNTVVRINEQGDLEVRRPDSWDLIGGLLGDYEKRVKTTTDLEWV